jgi:hypothetical protein
MPLFYYERGSLGDRHSKQSLFKKGQTTPLAKTALNERLLMTSLPGNNSSLAKQRLEIPITTFLGIFG